MATNTILRSLHDIGLASWFGGAVMGVTGLRGAAYSGSDSVARKTSREADGWSAWSPVVAVSAAAHLIGGAGLIVTDWQRHKRRPEVMRATVIKGAVTGAAMLTTLFQGVVGERLVQAEKDAEAGEADAQRRAARLRVRARALDAATPVLTGVMVILAAREGELQRPVAAPLQAVADIGSSLGAQLSGAVSDVGDRFGSARDAAKDVAGTVGEAVRSTVAGPVKGNVDTVLDKLHLAS